LSEQFFREARAVSRYSTCVKTKTGAVIVKNGEIISRGFNLCAPEGVIYGQSVSECPRMKIKTGANYELCSPVHAEVMAALNVRRGCSPEELAKFAGHLTIEKRQILSAFSAGELKKLNGATLYLVGHYWACDGCLRFLDTVGILKENVKFDPITGSETKDRYESGGITQGEST